MAGAGVLEQSFVCTKKQVQERLLEVCASGFAQNVEIRIVFVNLPVRNLRALRTARDPIRGQRPGTNGGMAHIDSRRGTRSHQQKRERENGIATASIRGEINREWNSDSHRPDWWLYTGDPGRKTECNRAAWP